MMQPVRWSVLLLLLLVSPFARCASPATETDRLSAIGARVAAACRETERGLADPHA